MRYTCATLDGDTLDAPPSTHRPFEIPPGRRLRWLRSTVALQFVTGYSLTRYSWARITNIPITSIRITTRAPRIWDLFDRSHSEGGNEKTLIFVTLSPLEVQPRSYPTSCPSFRSLGFLISPRSMTNWKEKGISRPLSVRTSPMLLLRKSLLMTP